MNAPFFLTRRESKAERDAYSEHTTARETRKLNFLCEALGLAEPVSLALPLLDLGYDQCRWPTHGAPALFCGHPQHATSSYCQYHFMRSRAA